MSTGCIRRSARRVPRIAASIIGTRSGGPMERWAVSWWGRGAADSCCSTPRTATRCARPWPMKACARCGSASTTKAPSWWRETDPMQCVILAGGLGTRRWPRTETCPKPLLRVLGQPFAWYQMQWLETQGVDEVVYCIGHQGDQIKRYWDTQQQPDRK